MTKTTDDGLKAELGLLDATMINVGTMIASAIYLVPAAIAAYFSGVFPTLLVWVVGGVVSLFGALSMAELGAAMPRAGGQFVYLKRAFGPVWGYLYGWGAAVIINPASIAAIAVGFATYLAYFIPMGEFGVRIAAVASIAILTLLNCFGLKLGAITQNVVTLVKIAAIIALIAICLMLPGGSAANLQPFWPTESLTSLIAPFGLAMVAVLYAYDGWVEITYVGSEMRNPERDMPLSILFSTMLVAVLYVGAAIGFAWVLGHAGVARSPRVASDAATAVLGTAGAVAITVSILISTLGSNNGIVFTAARIPYAMARDGQFFRWAGTVSERYAVPTTSLVAQGVWSSLLALSGTYNQLTTYVVFVSFLFYAMTCAAVIVLRRTEPDLPRPYRTWGYPVTPLVFIAFSGYLIWNTIVQQPLESAIGLGLLGLGLVFYFGWGWHRAESR
ncbi:MAG: amino acid permease [Gemmatimonadetes bacterium]|nr:amino acid permease [Gemmatimonadota bacterium]